MVAVIERRKTVKLWSRQHRGPGAPCRCTTCTMVNRALATVVNRRSISVTRSLPDYIDSSPPKKTRETVHFSVISTSLSIRIASRALMLMNIRLSHSVCPHMWAVARWLIGSGCRLGWWVGSDATYTIDRYQTQTVAITDMRTVLASARRPSCLSSVCLSSSPYFLLFRYCESGNALGLPKPLFCHISLAIN